MWETVSAWNSRVFTRFLRLWDIVRDSIQTEWKVNLMPEILKIIFAILTAVFGVYSFVKPEAVAQSSGFSLPSVAGRAEVRVTFGGFFLGLGLGAILLGGEAYQLLGLAYLITFVVRLVALAVEGKDGVLRREYLIFAAFELISGLVLFF